MPSYLCVESYTGTEFFPLDSWQLSPAFYMGRARALPASLQGGSVPFLGTSIQSCQIKYSLSKQPRCVQASWYVQSRCQTGRWVLTNEPCPSHHTTWTRSNLHCCQSWDEDGHLSCSTSLESPSSKPLPFWCPYLPSWKTILPFKRSLNSGSFLVLRLGGMLMQVFLWWIYLLQKRRGQVLPLGVGSGH